MRTITVAITVEAGQLVMDSLVDIPDGTYQAVIVLGGSADQLPVTQEISARERAAMAPERIDPAVLDRQIQTVGKSNFVLLCAALLRGTSDDHALMRLLPDTNADTSKRSIISTARRLVEDGHAQEVLGICISSNLSAATLAEARRLHDSLRGGNR